MRAICVNRTLIEQNNVAKTQISQTDVYLICYVQKVLTLIVCMGRAPAHFLSRALAYFLFLQGDKPSERYGS